MLNQDKKEENISKESYKVKWSCRGRGKGVDHYIVDSAITIAGIIHLYWVYNFICYHR